MTFSLRSALVSIHHRANLLHIDFSMAGGLLDDLEERANGGDWLHPETTEAIDLQNDAAYLRKLAAELDKRRVALIDNMPAQYREAAE